MTALEAMQGLGATGKRATMVVVVAEVELSLLKPLLPAALAPRRLFGPYGALSIQFLDIPESPVGPYRECTLTVMCTDELRWPASPSERWRSQPGFPIWIAVTSEQAQYYGREVWSYPKYVANVQVEMNGTAFTGRVAAPDGVSVWCEATLTDELEPTDVEFRSVSFDGNDLLLAPMPGRASFAEYWDPDARYALDLSRLGLGRIEGESSTGLYASEFAFELMPPTKVHTVGVVGRRRVRGTRLA